MKYCTKCGKELVDEAVVCTNCGCAAAPIPDVPKPAAVKDNSLAVVIKVFMVLSCVALGFFLIPLAWCIPMTVKTFRALDAGQPLSTGFKVCTLIFVSLIAGIIMLCASDEGI